MGGGVANLGQPANRLAVAPADGLGQEATQSASIGEQLQPNACREEKVSGGGGASTEVAPPSQPLNGRRRGVWGGVTCVLS